MNNKQKSLIDSLIDEIQYGLEAIYSNNVPKNHNENTIDLNKQQKLQSERIMKFVHKTCIVDKPLSQKKQQ